MRLPNLSTAEKVRMVALLVMVLIFTASYLACRQAYDHEQESRATWRAQQIRTKANWRRVLALPAPLVAQPAAAQAKAFSPLALQRAGARLVSWLPAAQGGEMTLDIQWPQVVATFAMLAEQDMQVAAFSLVPGEGGLRFNLLLVCDDER